MPKVSIIIPVYNVEKYLRQCLDSVINQTLKDIEIICVNDGSTDNSLSILQEYKDKDSRIILINQENQGAGISRNNAINIAKGEYIGFVDPDDWIKENMYQEMYNKAIQLDCDMVQCNRCYYYADKNLYKEHNFHDSNIKNCINKVFNLQEPSEDEKKYLFNYVVLWDKIFKKELIDKYNIKNFESTISEDLVFTIKAKYLSKRIIVLEDIYYFFRRYSNSVTCKKTDETYKIFKIFDNINDFMTKNGIFNEYQEELSKLWINQFTYWYFRTPDKKIKDYNKTVKKLLSRKNYKKYKKKIGKNTNIIQQIFSIKKIKSLGVNYKQITILGIKIKIKSK